MSEHKHKQYAANLAAMTRQINLIASGRTGEAILAAEPQLTVEELRQVQRAACALAAAAQAECDFYTGLITQLEPP